MPSRAPAGGRPPLSGIVIACNEEARLRRALDSLRPWCAELLVVDSHSTDRTRDVAREAGARVLEHDFESHVKQKNVAVDAAAHDWLLSLDADEQFDERLGEALAGFDWSRAELVGRFPRRNRYLGAWIDATGWARDSSARLFNRRRARFAGSWVHDRVEGAGCVEVRLAATIRHWPYRDLEHHLEKINRYTTRLGRELAEQGRRPSWVKLALDPPWKFVRMWLLQGGWRLGWRGFVVSGTAAAYVFLKYAKHWEAAKVRGEER